MVAKIKAKTERCDGTGQLNLGGRVVGENTNNGSERRSAFGDNWRLNCVDRVVGENTNNGGAINAFNDCIVPRNDCFVPRNDASYLAMTREVIK